MKKICLLTLTALIFFSVNCCAQIEKPNIVKMSIGLLNKVRLGYERTLNESFSAGAFVDAYYGVFPGFKAEPFARYYVGKEAPSGLYGQVRFLYGNFQYFPAAYYDSQTPLKNNLSTLGGGLDLGYQWISGKNKNIVVDVSLGIQVMSKQTNRQDLWAVDGTFYTTGPGAIFNPHLSIGYAF